VHNCSLNDTCERCGEGLRWRGVDLTRCGCRAGNLTLARAEPLSPASLAATRAVHGLLQDDRFASDANRIRAWLPFKDLEPERIVEFLWRLGLGIAGASQGFFSAISKRETELTPHAALQDAYEAMAAWPQGFYHALERTHERFGPSAENARGRLTAAIQRWLVGVSPGGGRQLHSVLFAAAAAEGIDIVERSSASRL
jgi:hypothetical protein